MAKDINGNGAIEDWEYQASGEKAPVRLQEDKQTKVVAPTSDKNGNPYTENINGIPVTSDELKKFNSLTPGSQAQDIFLNSIKGRQGQVAKENKAPAVTSTSTMAESNLPAKSWEKPLAEANKNQQDEDKAFNKATGSEVDNQYNIVSKKPNLNLTAEQYWSKGGPTLQQILDDANDEHLGVNVVKEYLDVLYAGHENESPYKPGTVANAKLKNHPIYKKILDHYEEVIKKEEALNLDTTEVREEAASMGINTDNIPVGPATENQTAGSGPATKASYNGPSDTELLNLYYRGHMPNFRDKQEQDRFMESLRNRWMKDNADKSPNTKTNTAPAPASTETVNNTPAPAPVEEEEEEAPADTTGKTREEVASQVQETGVHNEDGNYRERDEAAIKHNKELLKRRQDLYRKQEDGYLTKSEKTELDEINREIDAIKTGNDFHNLDEEDIQAIYDKGASIDDMMRDYREGGILHARGKALDENKYRTKAITKTISNIEDKLKDKSLSPEERAKLEDDLYNAKQDLDAAQDEKADIKNHYGRFILDAIEKGVGGLSTWGERGRKANKQQSEWDKLVETNLMAEANRHNKARDASTQAAINTLMTDADMTADNLKGLNALQVNDRALEQARRAGALESWAQYDAYVNQIADLFDPKNGYNNAVVAGVLKSKFGFTPLQAIEFLAANGIETQLRDNDKE